jgi:hypothetical protein
MTTDVAPGLFLTEPVDNRMGAAGLAPAPTSRRRGQQGMPSKPAIDHSGWSSM